MFGVSRTSGGPGNTMRVDVIRSCVGTGDAQGIPVSLLELQLLLVPRILQALHHRRLNLWAIGVLIAVTLDLWS